MLGPRAMVLESVGCMEAVVMAQILIMKSAHENIHKERNANLSYAVDATVAQCELHDCAENA